MKLLAFEFYLLEFVWQMESFGKNLRFFYFYLKENKNEITFLRGDRNRQFKKDWERWKIATTRLDCHVQKKATLEKFAKEYESIWLEKNP